MTSTAIYTSNLLVQEMERIAASPPKLQDIIVITSVNLLDGTKKNKYISIRGIPENMWDEYRLYLSQILNKSLVRHSFKGKSVLMTHPSAVSVNTHAIEKFLIDEGFIVKLHEKEFERFFSFRSIDDPNSPRKPIFTSSLTMNDCTPYDPTKV